MSRARWKQIVRQFPENGLKLLLEGSANVHDLLALAQPDLVPLVDFDRLQLVRTSFVARDFRHVEADVVLRDRGQRPGRSLVWLYVLLEHQSRPDRLMPLRLLDYLVQIIKGQLRAWSKTHRTLSGFIIQPVLPIVLYTGNERWESLGRLIDLVAWGERFRQVTPDFEPVFVNLPVLPAERLVSEGGFFGRVLQLVQKRKATLPEFRRLLAEVVEALEAMPSAERIRWLELLSYLHMLVYHERSAAEHRGLQETIEASVQTDPHRQEVQVVKRTIAQAMQEEGRRKGRREGREEGAVQALQQALLRLMQSRFGDLPQEIALTVNRTQDVAQLGSWLDRFAAATTVEDIGIVENQG